MIMSSLKKPINRKLYRQTSAFIYVHLRLICVSLSDRTQEIQFELFPKINENGLTESPQSTQRSQSLAIPVITHETAASPRIRTRMTRIARIFTDMCALFNSVGLKKLAVE